MKFISHITENTEIVLVLNLLPEAEMKAVVGSHLHRLIAGPDDVRTIQTNHMLGYNL